MTKATHDGTCQICGRLHRLPGGALAKHGYAVMHRGHGGYFSGTCGGSAHEPWEVSCELAKASIERVKADIAALAAFIAQMHVPVTEPRSKIIHRGHMVEFEVDCEVVTIEENGHTANYITWEFNGKTYRKWAVQLSLYGEPLEIAQRLNAYRANRAAQSRAQAQAYIDWQTERVNNWKPVPLLKRAG